MARFGAFVVLGVLSACTTDIPLGDLTEAGTTIACGLNQCGSGFRCCSACGLCAFSTSNCALICSLSQPDAGMDSGTDDSGSRDSGPRDSGPISFFDSSFFDSSVRDSGPGAFADGNSCFAADAWGVGACDFLIGYVWRGTSCAQVRGCSCNGSDCCVGGTCRVFVTLEACELAYSICL